MKNALHTAPAALEVLLASAIDYAGLFPPAALSMRESVANYSEYREAPESWALGRFVLPASRLAEFTLARATATSGEWRLAGILSGEVEQELAAVEEFNRKASGAVIDQVELRPTGAMGIEAMDAARRLLPAGVTLFYEVPALQADELLPVVRHYGARAKLRMGGEAREAFPEVEAVANFVARCSQLGLAFKATAGLHHALRGKRALCAASGAPLGAMHGFLNLFTAAAIAHSAALAGVAVPRRTLAVCLMDEARANWHADTEALTWSGDEPPVRLASGILERTRRDFALAFGSCSFAEPLAELRGLGLL